VFAVPTSGWQASRLTVGARRVRLRLDLSSVRALAVVQLIDAPALSFLMIIRLMFPVGFVLAWLKTKCVHSNMRLSAVSLSDG
jgi:hypothetical protein